MFKPDYLQDRLNAMVLTAEEVEAFKAEREHYAKLTMAHIAQEKLEAAREASINALKFLFIEEKEYVAPIDVRVFANHFGSETAKYASFGMKR